MLIGRQGLGLQYVANSTFGLRVLIVYTVQNLTVMW